MDDEWACLFWKRLAYSLVGIPGIVEILPILKSLICN